jgi:hypothetical protein
MTRRYGLLVAALIAVGTVGMNATSASAAGNQVPFHGTYSGSALFPSLDAGAFFGGTGTATHLGQGTNTGHSVITGPDTSCPGGLANINTETLAAANGDTLTITSNDVACPTGPLAFSGSGHWVVTGGTGRFSGATGQGTFDGHSDFIAGVFAMQLTGTISAPAEGNG